MSDVSGVAGLRREAIAKALRELGREREVELPRLREQMRQIEHKAESLLPGQRDARMFIIGTAHGEAAPADVYMAVRYRNLQFWVNDRDLSSPSAMTFLMLILLLAETGTSPAAAPQVTVPAR